MSVKQNTDCRKTFYITTLGCPKNTADSRSMHVSLLEEGLIPSDSPEKSDYHLINTCTFIKTATEETIETILNAGKIKKSRNQKLVVAGCFSQRYPGEIKKDMPEVDFLFGTGQYNLAGKLLKEKFAKDFSDNSKVKRNILNREILQDQLKSDGKPYSFVKISDGCNRGCSFCIIPGLRGEFKDQPEEKVLTDARNEIRRGSKEICLVSQDTVFYCKDTEKLKNLIQSLTELEGLEILRLLYLYPDKKTESLLDLIISNEKIAPYFESPVQHVSEKILRSMNRTGNYSFFLDLFAKARQRPGLEIRTSMIIGYPGETAADVDLILKFIEEVKPEKLALFPFSPQEGTKAFGLEPDPVEKEAVRRVNLIRNAHLSVLKNIHLGRIGKTYDAIIDEQDENGSVARRFQDAPEIDEVVYIPGEKLKIGTVGKIRVDTFFEYDMEGSWV